MKVLIDANVLLRLAQPTIASHATIVRNAVHGKLAHDTRIVAAMQRHGLTNLLTFNKPKVQLPQKRRDCTSVRWSRALSRRKVTSGERQNVSQAVFTETWKMD